MINMNQLYLQVKNKWKTLYPIYFNSKKSIAQGRRVPINDCVPEPTIEQLSTAVGMCKIRNILEPHKFYPKDYFYRGRLKVELLKDDKTPMQLEISNKKKLYKQVSANLKKLRGL